MQACVAEPDQFDRYRIGDDLPVTDLSPARIMVINGPGCGSSFSLSESVSSIGRNDDQAIQLDFGDSYVSRENHATILYDEAQGRYLIRWEGKPNPVRLNNRILLGTEYLDKWDHIHIGKTTLCFAPSTGGRSDQHVTQHATKH